MSDFANWSAISIRALFSLLSPTSKWQNMYPNNCSFRLLKSTYSSSFGSSLLNSVLRFIICFISSIANIVTGDPESTIVWKGFPLIFAFMVNCPLVSPSIVSTTFTSSAIDSSLISLHSSIRWICWGGFATLRLFANVPAPLVWQHRAKCPFLSHFIQVTPKALHSLRCCGVNIPSHLKHYLVGPQRLLVWLMLFISVVSVFIFGLSSIPNDCCLSVPSS